MLSLLLLLLLLHWRRNIWSTGKEGQTVVATVVAVEDFPISDLDDSSNLDCIYCLKDHNYSVVVGFVAEGVYYKCLQHGLQVAH